jgi:hypothetical protein
MRVAELLLLVLMVAVVGPSVPARTIGGMRRVRLGQTELQVSVIA